jgi:glycosyltransferase involved in cell wall biosynthesis
MSTSITAIILTYNETQHLERCIKSLKEIVEDIVVIDSYSKDNTTILAEELGARVFQNPWKNYATQFNWALNYTNIQSEWVWRIDADEFIEKPGFDLKEKLSQFPASVSGLYIKRKIVFMGKPLMHGGWFPVWHLKIWRHKKGFCENRWMDEHIKLTEGTTEKIGIIQVDENLNDLSWWTEKHNSYASREMIDLLDMQYQIFSQNTVTPKLFGTGEQRKRWLKVRYLNLPLFIRPFFYFCYRYFLKLGFLDGKAGFIWHILQGFWYRFLVDAKIFELKRQFNNDKEQIIKHIKEKYSI